VHEHRAGLVLGFTQRDNVKQLVHVEMFATAMEAMQREKNLKRWPRAWKTRLIGEGNPTCAISMRRWLAGSTEPPNRSHDVIVGFVAAISASDARSGIEIPGTRPGMTTVL
jgi:hypothetical protein